jgi:protein involved in polysaccharide export with SLBB domain
MMPSRLQILVRILWAAPLAWGLCARPASAQQPVDWDSRRIYTNRGELQALLARLDSVAAASTGSSDHKAEARRNAVAVRARLGGGDFQPGDRILLRVEGEQQLSDTFSVDESRSLLLPTIGAVPLAGVLRSELESYLRARLAVFIQKPVVRAQSLIRIAITGEVNRPGYYLLPPTSQVSDAIMAAGGPTHDSKLSGLVVQRTDGEVWGKDVVQRAIVDGRTLDQLGVRSGDRLFLPRHNDFQRTVTLLSALLTIPVTIYALTRLF